MQLKLKDLCGVRRRCCDPEKGEWAMGGRDRREAENCQAPGRTLEVHGCGDVFLSTEQQGGKSLENAPSVPSASVLLPQRPYQPLPRAVELRTWGTAQNHVQGRNETGEARLGSTRKH